MLGIGIFFIKRKCQICHSVLNRKFIGSLYFKLNVCSMQCNRKLVDLSNVPNMFNTIKVINIEGFINSNGFQSFRKIIESKGFVGIDTRKNELYVGK